MLQLSQLKSKERRGRPKGAVSFVEVSLSDLIAANKTTIIVSRKWAENNKINIIRQDNAYNFNELPSIPIEVI